MELVFLNIYNIQTDPYYLLIAAVTTLTVFVIFIFYNYKIPMENRQNISDKQIERGFRLLRYFCLCLVVTLNLLFSYSRGDA